MKFDIVNNFEITEGYKSDTLSATTFEGASVDHKKGPCSAFILNCGTFATSLSMKLQYSENNSDWTDEPDTSLGNDTTKSLTAAGTITLNCPNPRGRYTRALITSGGANEACLINVCGPKRFVAEGATTIIT